MFNNAQTVWPPPLTHDATVATLLMRDIVLAHAKTACPAGGLHDKPERTVRYNARIIA